jgi:PadR family transcriptional regulator PadR
VPQRMTDQTLRVLDALLEEPDRDRYGLDLMEAAGLSSGTAYPILHRLENDGWLHSWTEGIDPSVEGRPRRRLYRLTGLGEVEAKELLEARRKGNQRQPRPAARERGATA